MLLTSLNSNSIKDNCLWKDQLSNVLSPFFLGLSYCFSSYMIAQDNLFNFHCINILLLCAVCFQF